MKGVRKKRKCKDCDRDAMPNKLKCYHHYKERNHRRVLKDEDKKLLEMS